MWPHWAHILKPLTDISGRNKCKWEASQDQAYKEIKALISEDIMLHFPDITKPFHLFTDASDYQLGSTIIQYGKQIAFYSQELTLTQQCYSTIDKELLSIIESLLEFNYISAGTNITVHTDHHNLLSAHSRSDRVYRWKLAVQEFHPTYKYIKGDSNFTANTLSCLNRKDDYPDKDIEAMIEDSY